MLFEIQKKLRQAIVELAPGSHHALRYKYSQNELISIYPVVIALPPIFKSNIRSKSDANYFDRILKRTDEIYDGLSSTEIVDTIARERTCFFLQRTEFLIPAIVCAYLVAKILSVDARDQSTVKRLCEGISQVSGSRGQELVLNSSKKQRLLSHALGDSYNLLNAKLKSLIHSRLGQRANSHLHRACDVDDEVMGNSSNLWEIVALRSRRLPIQHARLIGFRFLVALAIFLFQMYLTYQLMGLADLNVSSIFLVAPSALLLSLEIVDDLSFLRKPERHVAYNDYSISGIPHEVCVAIPIIFNTGDDLKAELKNIAINVLVANDSNVKFVVLSDLVDSTCEPDPADELHFVHKLRQAVEELNLELGSRFGECIYYAHRERKFVGEAGRWLGEGRKLGKINLLNTLIITGASEFSSMSPRLAKQAQCFRYVMVLDQDSILTPNAIQTLAGALDHPANSVLIDGQEIKAGHGIAVPQIYTQAISLRDWRLPESVTKGLVDARGGRETTSLLFNDFGQAGYFGKGMFDPRVYAQVSKKVDHRSSLSHDTVEGDLLRPCFLGSVSVADAFPSGPLELLTRDERWARGDFQNLIQRILLPKGHRPRLSPVGSYVVMRQCLSWFSLASTFPMALLLSASVKSGMALFFSIALAVYPEVIERFLAALSSIKSGNHFKFGMFLRVSLFIFFKKFVLAPWRFGQVSVSLCGAISAGLGCKYSLDWKVGKNRVSRGSFYNKLVCGAFVVSIVALALAQDERPWAAVYMAPFMSALFLERICLNQRASR
ncbi:hypothetical protein [Pseudoxanthomonas sp. USHLN014]|uniref:hypothetical protein n=1 Tax=Pseudoxanthomonas sp. USHLN014 TaxID=3081297 RepID=UPI00301D6105